MTELTSSNEVQLPSETIAALNQAIINFTTGVVVVCGFPASGKSTAARYLASALGAIVFDKDGFAPKLEESVMTELTGNPHDRDSATYRRVVGPNIYDALVRNAALVGCHHPVVVDAPFLEYTSYALDSKTTLSEYVRSQSGQTVEVRTVWMSAKPDEVRERMISRGAERDLPKLADWSAYRSEVLDSGLGTEAEKAVDVFIVN
ncbi:AAA family ATPase [Nocardia sp. NPDC056000]|uniref:AAA family ATPase n=1 Tax=Nocardia sp. NPDC056000 TaxID=3345674 RepID=UPI0035DE8CD7